MELTAAMRAEYEDLFRVAKITDAGSVEWAIARVKQGWPRYLAVSNQTGVPAFVIALLHCLEASFNFGGHLHNGDPLSARTWQVPAGRPRFGSPPFTWEESAIDALTYDSALGRTWGVAETLHFLEGFNGWGYRTGAGQGTTPPHRSPYLWSMTNQYVRGKYVADGRFDSSAVSQQVGCCALLLGMAGAGISTFGPAKALPEATEKPYEPASVPPPAVVTDAGVFTYGAKGEHVRWLVSALMGLGFLGKAATTTDVFNENVLDAVKWAQRTFDLMPDDGRVGPLTVGELGDALIAARAPKSKILNVPYYSQRDFGGSQAWSICGVTSASMVLKFWGVNVNPDNTLAKFGKAAGQSPPGLEGIFEQSGLKADSTYNGSIADLRAHTSAGRPCIVHGGFTRSGHIIVVCGFEGDDVICNDPAGEWEEYVGDSYSDNPKNGKAVRYKLAAFKEAVGRDSGIWYSVAWK